MTQISYTPLDAFVYSLNCNYKLKSYFFFSVNFLSFLPSLKLYTVGYGDIAPKNQWMRLFSVVYLPTCIVVTSYVLGKMAKIYFKRKTRVAEQKYFENRQLSMDDISRMDTHQDGFVTYEEFLTYMLIAMGKVQGETVDSLKKLYNDLDVTNNGKLTKEDVFQLAYGNDDKQHKPSSKMMIALEENINLDDDEENNLNKNVEKEGQEAAVVRITTTSPYTTNSNDVVDEDLGGVNLAASAEQGRK